MSQDPPKPYVAPIIVGRGPEPSHKFKGRHRLEHGIYIGKNPRYHGMGAIMRRGRKHKVLLQFDDTATERAHGWFEFLAKDFAKGVDVLEQEGSAL